MSEKEKSGETTAGSGTLPVQAKRPDPPRDWGARKKRSGDVVGLSVHAPGYSYHSRHSAAKKKVARKKR